MNNWLGRSTWAASWVGGAVGSWLLEGVMRLLLVFPFLDLRLLLVIALFVALGLFRPLFFRLLCGSGAGVLRVRPDP